MLSPLRYIYIMTYVGRVFLLCMWVCYSSGGIFVFICGCVFCFYMTGSWFSCSFAGALFSLYGWCFFVCMFVCFFLFVFFFCMWGFFVCMRVVVSYTGESSFRLVDAFFCFVCRLSLPFFFCIYIFFQVCVCVSSVGYVYPAT